MRELNVYHHELRHNEYDEFYLKYEADKVIAEKDKELRHQKFKRCLAMAEFCQYRSEMFFTWSKKMGFLLKWQNRWLEIAEQFKETK